MPRKEPKYKQIQNDLRRQITSGQFEYGDKFYTEAELLKRYKVSSITVIRALQELENEGYIDRKQGVGTFVSRSRKEKIVKFSDIERFPTSHDVITVLSLEKGNDPHYLNQLELHKAEFYYKIDRVRYTNDKAYIYHQSYIPHDYIFDDTRPLAKYQSIYRRFLHDYQIHMSDEYFSEVNSIVSPAPKHVGGYLDLGEHCPAVLQIKKTTYRKNGRILEYTESYKHWKYFKFKIESTDTFINSSHKKSSS